MKARFNFWKHEYSLPLILGLIIFIVLNLNGLELTLGAFHSGSRVYRVAMLYGFLSNASIFYLVADRLVPRLLKKRHFLAFSLWFSLIFVIFTTSETFIDIALLKQIYLNLDELIYELAEYNVISHIFVMVAAVIYRFSNDWFMNEQLQRQLKEEKLSSELSFLKSQINPHFLFNTLNNLFSSAQKNGDEETAAGIAQLANLMRYMLHTSDQTSIRLEEEIKYLESFIELQTMRWRNSEQLQLSVSFPETPADIHIKPMILIPFIENAFKYGVSSHIPSRIIVSLEAFYGSVIFHCTNDIVNDNQLEASGIGLTNVKRRLELLYKDSHQLDIKQDKDQFTVQLELT
ncbi:MAG: histidine kinase [Roseivirga sp.]|nr:histidine kinase [Roseivirga sp.]